MWNPITASELKNKAIKLAKENGNTHTTDIDNMVILLLSCQLSDALNHIMHETESSIDIIEKLTK